MSANYQIKIDCFDDNELYKYLDEFSDANIYQTPAYCRKAIGGKNLSHLLLFNDNQPSAMVLVRVKKIPIVNSGFAHIYWGPLWQKKNRKNDLTILRAILKEISEEYVKKRKLILRIISNLINDASNDYDQLFKENKFAKYDEGQETFILDLKKDLDQIRKNFRGNWRGHLNRAERNKNLSIISGYNNDLFQQFSSMYQTMIKRKKFSDIEEVTMFADVQKDLPDNFKMSAYICLAENEPVASVVVTSLGNSAIYLLGATTKQGLKTQSSYLLQWDILKKLKEKGTANYDLGGINKLTNPGVYHFKEGFAGEKVKYIGKFEKTPGIFLKLLGGFVEAIYKLHKSLFSSK